VIIIVQGEVVNSKKMKIEGRAFSEEAIPRLSARSLATLSSRVQQPAYDRSAITSGIVHLGLGAFCRGHLAVYTDDVLASGARGWGITGVSMMSSKTRDALKPQDCLYSVLSRQSSGDQLRVIGSILDALVVPDQLEQLLALMVDPQIRIVTLTVTEKGYCQDAATGELDEANKGILADLVHPRVPRTVPGLLTEAVRLRRDVGVAPFTVLACDNLPQNGATARRMVVRFAQLCDKDLGRYIAENVSFPSSMVDRITPATQDEDRANIAAQFGVVDAWPVVCEPFRQWVIEDRFPQGRPKWEDVGALLVDDVHPFELMKLRCLNGAHSALAYLSVVAGIETIAEAMSNRQFSAVINRLWSEDLIPTLPPIPGTNVSLYTQSIEKRFLNPGVRHRVLQISADGSKKLPPRLLEPAMARLQAGARPRTIALAVAAWMRFVIGVDERAEAYEIVDPLAPRLCKIAQDCGNNAERLAGELFSVTDIFPPALVQIGSFGRDVEGYLKSLLTKGVHQTLADFLA
jgi:fructuronate reductase